MYKKYRYKERVFYPPEAVLVGNSKKKMDKQMKEYSIGLMELSFLRPKIRRSNIRW